jgi:hypothetical protein
LSFDDRAADVPVQEDQFAIDRALCGDACRSDASLELTDELYIDSAGRA